MLCAVWIEDGFIRGLNQHAETLELLIARHVATLFKQQYEWCLGSDPTGCYLVLLWPKNRQDLTALLEADALRLRLQKELKTMLKQKVTVNASEWGAFPSRSPLLIND